MEFVLSLTNRATRRPDLPRLGLPSAESRWSSRGIPSGPGRQTSSACALRRPASCALPTPGAGRTRSCRLPVPTGRRGVLELPPLRCWAHDPFGLFGSPGPLTPAVRAVDPSGPAGSLPAHHRAGRGPSRFRGPAAVSSSGRGLGDLEGIRPYVVGDRLSLLHWPAKARYGTWFVRQFGTEGTAAVPLVFDDRAGVHRKADFERLVSSHAVGVGRGDARPDTPSTSSPFPGSPSRWSPASRDGPMASLVLAELQPSPLATEAASAIPAGSVLLTTRTGAERLTQLSGPGGDPRRRRRCRVGHRRDQRTVVVV